MVSATDAKGQTTHYTYNPINQVIRIEYGDDTAYDYSYDNANRLTGIHDGANTLSFGYDILDRLISASLPQGSITYSYDRPQGSITYSYDLVSRMTGFSSPAKNNRAA